MKSKNTRWFLPSLRTSIQPTRKRPGGRTAAQSNHQPQLERLEDRTLLSLRSSFRVNNVVTSDQFLPATASSTSGAHVLVWDDLSGDDTVIKAQRYGASGNPVGDEIAVATSPVVGDPQLAAGMDSAGDFVVVFSALDIGFVRYNAAGEELGRGTVGDPNLGKDQPSAAMSASGSFVVAYQVQQSARNVDVYADLFDANGTLLRTIRMATSKKAVEGEPSVASAADGLQSNHQGVSSL